MTTTLFEDFVNAELPLRIGTVEAGVPTAGKLPVYKGVGLLTEAKTLAEAGIATTADITKVWKDQGNYDVSVTGAWPTSANTIGAVPIKAGFLWVVTNAGTGTTLTGGTVVSNGDTLRALIDDAGNNAAHWGSNEANLGYTPENQTNKVGNLTDSTSETKYPNVKAVFDGLELKQNALADVITANTYGSSTQYPVITFNAKGIATGVTLQTVSVSEVSDSVFRIVDNDDATKKLAFELSGIATTTTHTITAANKAVNLGDLPNVATTDSNNLSGTRTRILGGSSNTVSGTDVTLVNSSNNYFTSCTNVQANNVWWVGQAANPPSKYRITYNSSSFSQPVAGSSNLYNAALGSTQCLYTDGVTAHGVDYNCTLDGDNTLSSTNCAPVIIAGTIGAAVHDIDMIVAIGTGNPLVPVRHLFAKRRVYAQLKSGSVASSSTITIDTDTFVGDAATGSVSVGVTVDFTNNRLVPTITGTAGSGQNVLQASVRITSHFNRK